MVSRKALVGRIVLGLMVLALVANMGVLAANWAAGGALLTKLRASAGASYAWQVANSVSSLVWAIGLALNPVSTGIAIGVSAFMIA